MLSEATLIQYDEYLTDREARKLKGQLTEAEKQEEKELAIAKEELAKIFGG